MTQEFLRLFIGFIDRTWQERREKKLERRNAVFFIEQAANRTINHIQAEGYSPSKELSDLWVEAARLIHPFDRELSERLVSKADMWAFPERWESVGTASTIITINEIKQKAEVFRNQL